MDRRIEDGLQRRSDTQKILVMEVGGDLNHSEPDRRELPLDLCMVDMLAHGADVDTGPLGNRGERITCVGCLQPLRLFRGGDSTSCHEFGRCLHVLISVCHKFLVMRPSSLFSSVISVYALGMRSDRSPAVTSKPVVIDADLKARVAAERVQQGLGAQITDLTVLSRLAIRVRQSSP